MIKEGLGDVLAYPLTGRSQVRLEVTKSERLQLGFEGKRLISGLVNHRFRPRPISLVERVPESKADQEFLLSRWKLAIEKGLPVPPTVRLSSRGTLLISDVTADGSEVYGKGRYFDMCVSDYSEHPLTKSDRLFLKIITYQYEQVKKAAENYGDFASKVGLIPPFDDAFELIIRPDGSWKLMTLDMKFLMEFDINDTVQCSSAENENKFSIDRIFSSLKRMREALLARQGIQ